MNNPAQKPLNNSVSDIQSQLIDISSILDISDCNAQFTYQLAKFIQQHSDKPLDQLTLAELISIIDSCRNAFNKGVEPELLKGNLKNKSASPGNLLPKVSRFNVLDKSRRLIAEHVTFDQAKQYQDCIVKFAGMEVIA